MTENCLPSQMTGFNAYFSLLQVDIPYQKIILVFREKLCLKPIFHQNAKYLGSGTFASPNAKDSTSASPNARVPTCWYILALPNANICVIPDAKPQRQPVEYSLRWVLGVWSRVGQVHFIFFAFISFALGSVFPVEYGLYTDLKCVVTPLTPCCRRFKLPLAVLPCPSPLTAPGGPGADNTQGHS